MPDLLWLIPAAPLASAVLLAVPGSRWPRRAVSALGVGSIGLSAVLAIAIAAEFLSAPPPDGVFRQTLWTWMGVAGFQVDIGFHLDALSLLMTVVVAFVSFFIHLYSTEYMAEDEGYSRFFAYMNLFVASMITLLLADNLLLLFLGWEGVGLCSYLLIGFWYRDPANGRAARKAFLVTRVGDTAFTVAILLLVTEFGTLDIQELMRRTASEWGPGSALATVAGLLLLGGAAGKSAQLPLQTWLPDAMAGPTPTSALIHAATMVTAGVYLIARTNALFALSAEAMAAVAATGALTLLLAGFSALAQTDLKRALAYSTVSQIGYMFLALGVGAWSAAIFHFMTHAFFKALLFLCAGVVIEALHHEQNVFRMGGLRRSLPLTFWSFLAGGSALAGLPLVTSGFYSKDLILWHSWSSPHGGTLLWAAGMAGALLTALYTYRLVFLVFFGEPRGHVVKRPGRAMQVPLAVLAVLSLAAGFVNLPPSLGNLRWFDNFMAGALPRSEEGAHGALTEAGSALAASAVFALGLALAWLLFLRRRDWAEAAETAPPARRLLEWWQAGFGFDWLYDRLLVRPTVWLAGVNRRDFVDTLYHGAAQGSAALYRALSATENGLVRAYAAGIVGGAIFFLALSLLL